MNTNLAHKKVAVLATDGFEQAELAGPIEALRDAGADVKIVSPSQGPIQGMKHADKGDRFPVDIQLDDARPQEFDALVLPGGLINPDSLRSNPLAIDFVKAFAEDGKPIGAICHGPWLLIEAGLTKGRTLTSWPAIQTDIRNAGGKWVDREVVVDHGIVTSRKPDDVPAFSSALIEQISQALPA